VGELTGRLSVSEVTVRKDLSLLEDAGYLVRTRGGAMLAEDREHTVTLSVRRNTHIAEKEAIARVARTLVHEGDTIFIDSGSTCTMFAGTLGGMSLRVVTNSIDVLVSLSQEDGINLYSLGGSLRNEAGSFIGPQALESLKNYQIQTCFMGTTGFSSGAVFSAQNINEAQIKRAVIEKAERSVVLADRSKLGVNAFSVFARPEEIDILVSDVKPDEAEQLRRLELELLIAKSPQTA